MSIASTDTIDCSLSLYFPNGSLFLLHQLPQTTVPQHVTHTRAYVRASTHNGHKVRAKNPCFILVFSYYWYTYLHLWRHTCKRTHTPSPYIQWCTVHKLKHKHKPTVTNTSAHTYRHTPCHRRPLSSRLTPAHHGPQFKPRPSSANVDACCNQVWKKALTLQT